MDILNHYPFYPQQISEIPQRSQNKMPRFPKSPSSGLWIFLTTIPFTHNRFRKSPSVLKIKCRDFRNRPYLVYGHVLNHYPFYRQQISEIPQRSENAEISETALIWFMGMFLTTIPFTDNRFRKSPNVQKMPRFPKPPLSGLWACS